MTKTYLPEARKSIVRMLYSAQLAWITTMMDESFSYPDETPALEMMLDAHAATIGKHLEGHPDRQALLRAYALEMMDLAECDSDAINLVRDSEIDEWLTQDDINFFVHHDIPLYQVFNATGMRRKDWMTEMKKTDALIAVGVTPCKAEGHTMRSRAGHCVACTPANISHLKRHDRPGYVYVAVSKKQKIVKVGTTINLEERASHLNSYAYGGQWDWEIKFSQYCAKAGWIETLVHQDLVEYKTTGSYCRKGVVIDCNELFNCSPDDAMSSLSELARRSPPE